MAGAAPLLVVFELAVTGVALVVVGLVLGALTIAVARDVGDDGEARGCRFALAVPMALGALLLILLGVLLFGFEPN